MLEIATYATELGCTLGATELKKDKFVLVPKFTVVAKVLVYPMTLLKLLLEIMEIIGLYTCE